MSQVYPTPICPMVVGDNAGWYIILGFRGAEIWADWFHMCLGRDAFIEAVKRTIRACRTVISSLD
jgi:hypothetical protein